MRTLSAIKPTSAIDMGRPSVYPVAVLFVLLALTGCAAKGGVSWEKDKPLIIDSVQQAHAADAAMQAKLDAMEARVFELEKTVKQQEAENKALAANLKALRDSQPLAKTPAQASKDQRLTKKLEKIESSIRSATTKGAAVVQPTDKSIEKNSYTAAYLALKSGRYEESVIGFKNLLHNHPKGEYADQAYFWLGESYFVQRKMTEAIDAFNTVATDYPDSAKHPASLLKLASAYMESDRSGDAKAALQRLIQQHPESNAAEQARTQLKTIEAGQKR